MKMRILTSLLVLFLLAGIYYSAQAENPGGTNYLNIRKMYYKWDQGPYGSRSYFYKQLHYFLIEMIGRDVTTDFDYIPDFLDEKRFEARVFPGEWIVINGEIADDDKKKIDAVWKKYGRHSQPGMGLFSISGKIRKFRLSDYSDKRIVYLYLENIKIRHSADKSEANN